MTTSLRRTIFEMVGCAGAITMFLALVIAPVVIAFHFIVKWW
jgi:hypothetical protein